MADIHRAAAHPTAPCPLVRPDHVADPHADLMLGASHRRSADFGLARDDQPDFSTPGVHALAEVLEQNRCLHAHALPVMETLYAQIVNTHNMVVLTDAQGVIMQTMGDADFLEKADRVALQHGVSWSERGKGTNAIGTAIAERLPTLVHADQHFLRANHFLTCSAAPIFNHHGDVVGVLDVSGDQRSYHQHTMALVRMSAQMIENQLFAGAFDDAITLHFHSRPEFIGTLMEGIISFTPGGRFLAASRSALFQLGSTTSILQSHTFSSLFGIPLSALFEHYRSASAAATPLDLCLHDGVRFFARADLCRASLAFAAFAGVDAVVHGDTSTATVPTRAPAASSHQAQPEVQGTTLRSGSARLSGSLDDLDTGDAALHRTLEKVRRVAGHDIAILITGETGTGKELLAQAIHHDSARAGRPFCAVNCAAIPEALIESELFGYEEGAFTGARRKGSPGKIQQAEGGTLFLDEIGDMPLALQARLLRVLQEREITPLGAARAVAVDIALVCATNRNLRQLIARNLFREDLYYRLNGLVVKLPPLRERSDFYTLVAGMLKKQARVGGPANTLAPDALAVLLRHPWPGNLRQLDGLLRTAGIMAGTGAEIGRDHLPDDFFDDLEQSPCSVEAMAPAARILSDAGAAVPMKLDESRTLLIQSTLARLDGNVSAAARVLGISRNTIYRLRAQ